MKKDKTLLYIAQALRRDGLNRHFFYYGVGVIPAARPWEFWSAKAGQEDEEAEPLRSPFLSLYNISDWGRGEEVIKAIKKYDPQAGGYYVSPREGMHATKIESRHKNLLKIEGRDQRIRVGRVHGVAVPAEYKHFFEGKNRYKF